MNILKVKLRGFIGIKKGLGLDEIEVDFYGLTGLIALEGANGMGKTTLLENLQPFRMLPSRTGTLKSHCYLKDSFKELTFEFNGNIYRTLIKIDATTTRSDEGYIYLNGAEGSEVDSKVSNYDAYIENLLGSPALFFSSIFCAQNSRKLSDLRPAELKALFAEFLRLDRYVDWEDTAKAAIRTVTAAQKHHEDVRMATDTKARMMGDPRNDLKSAQVLLKKAVSELEVIDSKEIGVRKALEELKNEVAEIKIKRQRIEDHQNLITALQNEYSEFEKAQTAATIARNIKISEYTDELIEKEAIINQKEAIEQAVENKLEAENEIHNLDNDLRNLVLVQQSYAKEMEELKQKIHDANQRITKLQNDSDTIDMQRQLEKAERDVTDLQGQINNIESDQDIVKEKTIIAAMEKSARVLDGEGEYVIDPECVSQVCGFIASSLADRADLPRVRERLREVTEKKLKDITEKRLQAADLVVEMQKNLMLHQKNINELTGQEMLIIDGLNEQIDKVDAKITSLQDKSNGFSESINQLRVNIVQWKPLTEKHALLVSAESIAQALNKNIKAIKAEADETAKASIDKRDDTKKKVEEYQAVIEKITINEDANKQLFDANFELENLSEQRKKFESDQARMTGEIPKYEAEIETLATYEAELKALGAKIEYCREQIAQWDYLRIACSKDGMRALEIDAVAPVITNNANELLSLTFGPNYSVRFETQDEDGKEVLSIIVIANDGSETQLQFLSGGEKVWILKALRLAQTLISQEKSGRHFQTALMDEEDGALSADNAISFIKLYRSFQTMAAMDLCVYITHRPEAVALADNIIRFSPGKVAVL